MSILQFQSGIVPSFHIVLGSGFKHAVEDGIPSRFKIVKEVSFTEVPGMKSSTAPGHAGKFFLIEDASSKQAGYLQLGRLHGYEGYTPQDVVAPLIMTRELGVSTYVLTNAAGGMDDEHQVGDAMIITDHVNLTGKNPLMGPNPKKKNGEEWGPRFPDLTKLYDVNLQARFSEAMTKENLKVHRGVYIAVLGPSFETPAEIRLFKSWGMGAVGMSTVWEAIAVKHTGATVAGVSLISNIAAGLDGDEEIDHLNILEACRGSSTKILRGILNSLIP